MPTLRLIAWNCHHGSLAARLADLANYRADIVFLQECGPAGNHPVAGQFISRMVGARKSIALGSPSGLYPVAELECPQGAGRACVAAAVSGPASFTVLGIWSRGPGYANDVMQTIEAHGDLLRRGPAVVMGDFNVGARLSGERTPGKGHRRIVGALADVGLVSAYHAFHEVEHGRERHATYCHQFKPVLSWHIDFCFVPVTWIECVAGVRVMAGARWAKRSDHFPLMVDLRLPPGDTGETDAAQRGR
jgi:endonuclease/exonuclease/phosphatase family metal-dependent hydrolase